MNQKTPNGPAPTRSPIALAKYFWAFRNDAVGFVRRRFEDYGDMYYAPLQKTRLYVTRHPDHAAQVLLKQANNFKKTESGRAAQQLKRFLGDGLLNSNGDFWKRQRRLIQPAFRRQRIEGYADTMVEFTQDMLSNWRPGQQRDISREMMTLTLRIVAKTLFDHDTRDDAHQVAEAMTSFRDAAVSVQILPTWVPTPGNRRNRKALESIDSLVYRLIDERRGTEGTDLLSLLSAMVDDEDGQGMPKKLIRDEVLTLFLAGHETTSHALTWTWHLLAKHPQIEAKLHDELDAVLNGRAPTMADLGDLPYLDMVLKEAMRLYPPAYVISRTAIEDCEVGGFFIPAGAELLIWIYHVHHDARWFPEPEAFRPERFSPEREAALPKCAYIPFAAGTRTCIGKRFAMMEAQLILATMAQTIRLRSVPGWVVERDLKVTLAPKNGLPMRLAAR